MDRSLLLVDDDELGELVHAVRRPVSRTRPASASPKVKSKPEPNSPGRYSQRLQRPTGSARKGNGKTKLAAMTTSPAPKRDKAPSGTHDLPPLAEVADRIDRLQRTFEYNDGLSARIALGLRWIAGGSGALAAFVADSDGLALANHQAPEAYVAVSPELAAVQDTLNSILPSPVEGSVVVSVDESNSFQLLLCETAIGRLGVGLVLTEPLPAAAVRGVRSIIKAATQR